MDLGERLAHQSGVGSQRLAMAENWDLSGGSCFELHYEKGVSCSPTVEQSQDESG